MQIVCTPQAEKPLPHRLDTISQLPAFNKNSNTCKLFKQIMYIRVEPLPSPRSPELAAMCLETKSSPGHLGCAGVVITGSPVVLVALSPWTCSTKATVWPGLPLPRWESNGSLSRVP